MQYLIPSISDCCFEVSYATIAGCRRHVAALRANARRDRSVGREAQAIKKFDAVIESARPHRRVSTCHMPSLDSIHKMAVEASAGLALAGPPNNVLGWLTRPPFRANGIPDK
jgi:hypothetical protein